MSLTFTADYRGAVAHVVTCGCPQATAQAPRYGTYDDAVAALPADGAELRPALPGCEMPELCPEYQLHVESIDPDGAVPAVNVHDRTARELVDLLGLAAQDCALRASPLPDSPDLVLNGPEMWGQMGAEAFLGRVLMALALAPTDAGMPGVWHGRHFEGGRATGRLQQLLRDLHALAQWCARYEREVSWA